MKYLIDTDICIYWLKGNRRIETRIWEKGLPSVCISFITVSELYYGAYKSQKTSENIASVRKLTERVSVVNSTDSIDETFGKLKTMLEKKGRLIADADIFVAACALEESAVLVTNNVQHFGRISSLKIENWLND